MLRAPLPVHGFGRVRNKNYEFRPHARNRRGACGSTFITACNYWAFYARSAAKAVRGYAGATARRGLSFGGRQGLLHRSQQGKLLIYYNRLSDPHRGFTSTFACSMLNIPTTARNANTKRSHPNMEKSAAQRLASHLRALGHRVRLRQHRPRMGTTFYSVEFAPKGQAKRIRK